MKYGLLKKKGGKMTAVMFPLRLWSWLSIELESQSKYIIIAKNILEQNLIEWKKPETKYANHTTQIPAKCLLFHN